jgi:hypothetical protein
MRESEQHGDRVFRDGRRVHAAGRGQRQAALRVERVIGERIHAGHVQLHPRELGRARELTRGLPA